MGHPCLVFNSGKPGATTIIGKENFKRDVLELYPDLVIMMFGTNDSMVDVFRGKSSPRVSATDYQRNLCYFVDELKGKGCESILMTLPPLYMTEKLREYYDGEPYQSKGFNFLVDQYCDIIRSVAKNRNAFLVDLNKLFWEGVDGRYEMLPDWFLDGMHPNDRGQTMIANEIMNILNENPRLLANRAEYADKVGGLEVNEPQAESIWDERITVKLNAMLNGVSHVQYRFKAHYGEESKATFGDWRDFDFEHKNNTVTGRITRMKSNKYSLQFRALDARGMILALGGVDHITVQ